MYIITLIDILVDIMEILQIIDYIAPIAHIAHIAYFSHKYSSCKKSITFLTRPGSKMNKCRKTRIFMYIYALVAFESHIKSCNRNNDILNDRS